MTHSFKVSRWNQVETMEMKSSGNNHLPLRGNETD